MAARILLGALSWLPAVVACTAVDGGYDEEWPRNDVETLPVTILIEPGSPTEAPGYDWLPPRSNVAYRRSLQIEQSIELVNTLREEFARSGCFRQVRAGGFDSDATRVEVWYRSEFDETAGSSLLFGFSLCVLPFWASSTLQLSCRVVSPDGTVLGSFEVAGGETTAIGLLALIGIPFTSSATLPERLAREAALRVATLVDVPPPLVDELDDPWRAFDERLNPPTSDDR